MRKKISNKYRARILICDDDRGIIDALKKVLTREQYYVDSVTTSRECIHKVKNDNFDVLILDFLIDEQNGEQVISAIRKFSNIWIILLTGHRNLAPPIGSLRSLNIQGYCEKTSNLEHIVIQVEVAFNAISFFHGAILHYRFSDIFTALREYNNYTQDDVAKLIQVNRGTIIDFENGRSIPATATLIKLSDLFGVNIDILLGRIIHKLHNNHCWVDPTNIIDK
jgi:DNA-binding response OmpR family regulator